MTDRPDNKENANGVLFCVTQISDDFVGHHYHHLFGGHKNIAITITERSDYMNDVCDEIDRIQDKIH